MAREGGLDTRVPKHPRFTQPWLVISYENLSIDKKLTVQERNIASESIPLSGRYLSIHFLLKLELGEFLYRIVRQHDKICKTMYSAILPAYNR